MLAFYVHDLSPFLVRFNDTLGVRWYGVAYVAAFLIGIALVRYFSRRGFCDIPETNVADFIIGGAIFGVILGGRLGYMLFYDLGDFLANPLIIFKVWDGGMSAHGGMIGITLYTVWYARRHHIPWLNIGDNVVVAAPLGLFLGRLANFVNGELYGRVTSVAWAVQFPGELLSLSVSDETRMQAVQAASAINPQWVTAEDVVEHARSSPALRESLAGILSPRHPSQIYEAFLEGALLFGVLWLIRTRIKTPNGVLTGAFFIGYAILRSVAEFFREPDAPLTGALTRGQFLSVFLIILGGIIIAYAYWRPTYPSGAKS